MLDKLRGLPDRFQRDENGQAMIVAAILAFVLMRSTAMSFNVGVAVAERIRTQIVADMAAYSGAVWQARFLNYCAYTRRAIIANYGNVAYMSALSANKRLMDGVTDASTLFITLFVDEGQITDGLESFTQTLREQLVPGDDDDFGNIVPNAVDGRMIAELEARLLAFSQEALFWAITPVESIQDKVVKDVYGGANHNPGEEFKLATTEHASIGLALPGGLEVPISVFWNMAIVDSSGAAALGQPESFPLLGGSPIIERAPLTLEAVESVWDEGMTHVTLPPHVGGTIFGSPAFMGRNWIGIRQPPSCGDIFFLETQFFTTALELFIWDLPFLPSPLPFTEMENERLWSASSNFIHNDSISLIDLGTGFWWLFYISFSTPFGCIIIAVGFPIILFDFPNFGEEQDDDYEFLRPFDEVMVYEMKDFERSDGSNSVDVTQYEPHVYAAVARTFDTTDYARTPMDMTRALGLLEDDPEVFPGRPGSDNRDIVALARAKVTFSAPTEVTSAAPAGLDTGGAKIPNLNYPFWSARMARLEHGHNWTLWQLAVGGLPSGSWQSTARILMGLGIFGNTEVKY